MRLHHQELLEADLHANFKLPKDAKRVVTFLRDPPQQAVVLPIEKDGATILGRVGTEVFTAQSGSVRGRSRSGYAHPACVAV